MTETIESPKHIALIGMMGTGKTHMGKKIAEHYGRQFVDMDDFIEQKTGITIAEIFHIKGESYFRELEVKALKEIASKTEQTIIATGGGCITSKEARAVLLKQCTTLWLQSEPEDIYERIKGNTARPLLKTKDPLQTLEDLSKSREKYYAQADIHIRTTPNDPKKTLNDTIKALLAFTNTDK